MKCFYHSADLDGHCSGAIVKYNHPECELIGINYGDKFPWNKIKKGETVYMVDFSLQPFSDMVGLWNTCNLIWIDHHKSAIEESEEHGMAHIAGIRKDGIGACSLVWDYFKPPMKSYCVELLAEYDVWNHSNPTTLPFQYGIRLYHTIPDEDGMEFWVDFFDPDNEQDLVTPICEQGKLILSYINSDNAKYVSANSFETMFAGLKCIAVNKGLTNSQLFDTVWNPEKYDAMLTFVFRKGKWTVSLYSDKPDIDVSVIAKENGGGGHKGAAGFQTDDITPILWGSN